MRIPAWQWTAGVLLVTSMAGCTTVSEKWSQWRGKRDQQVEAAALAQPLRLHATTERGRWDGVYRYAAGAASFQECQTGETIPVQLSGDSALLESTYMAARTGPERAMLATVDGTIVEEAVADPVLAQRGNKQLALRVERFISLSSTASCAGGKAVALGAPALPAADAAVIASTLKPQPVAKAPDAAANAASATSSPASTGVGTTTTQRHETTAELGSTYWKLLSLQGKKVPHTNKEAHIILQGQGKLAGSGPCNRLLGSWRETGSQLRFTKVGSTRMACRGDAQVVESGLIKALEQTHRSRIQGQRLELLDAHHKVLAVFEAVALR